METHPQGDLNKRKSSNNVEELGRMLDENIESLMAEDTENIELADNTINSVDSTSNIETTDSPEVKKSPSKKTLLSIGGAVLALTITAATFFGIGASKRPKESNKPTQSYTDPSMPTTTIEQPIVTAAQTTETSANNIKTVEIFEQKISVEKMSSMTIEEFAKLPYADRAAYYYSKIPKASVAKLNEKFNPDMIVGRYWQEIIQGSIGAKDPNDRAKFISTMAYYTIDSKTGGLLKGYKDSVDTIIRIGGSGVGAGTAFSYISSGETQTGIDANGKKIKFTNITYKTTNRTTGAFISEETSQAIEMTIKLQDGRTIVAYPSGYTINGKQAPDESYPY